jgi:hypothetical protein
MIGPVVRRTRLLRRADPARPPARALPRLEELEPRDVPSSIAPQQPAAAPAAFTPSPAILFSALIGHPIPAPAATAASTAPPLAPTASAAAQQAAPLTPPVGPPDALFTVLLSSGGGSVLRVQTATADDAQGNTRPGAPAPEEVGFELREAAAPPEEAGSEPREAAAPPAEAGSEVREATPPPAGAESKPDRAAPAAPNAPAQSPPREDRGDQGIDARSEARPGAVSADGPLWDRWPAAVMAVAAAATYTGAPRWGPKPTWEI